MIRFRSKNGADLPTRLDALASAVELADGRLDDEAVAFARHVVDKAQARLRHGTTHTLVAMLGATGSGKSSVTNLLVGNDVATTGIRRPTTSSTLACVWGGDDASALLDWLEVDQRHRVGEPGPGREPLNKEAGTIDLDGMIVLDVPDHDSVASAHREEMERIAEHADLLVWVTDPEKYADKAMHDYLARLAGHDAVMALVLNKVDQLSEDEREACLVDLRRLLNQAELDGTPVVGLSASTGAGRDELVQLLGDVVTTKHAAVERLRADAAMAADGLHDELGPVAGPRHVATSVSDRLAEDLVQASGIESVGQAVAAGHQRDGASRTGWPFSRWVRRLRPHPLRRLHLDRGSSGRTSLPRPSGAQQARSEAALRAAADSVTADLPDPWPRLVRRAATPDENELNDRIDLAVSDAVRHSRPHDPRWWTAVGGLQWALAAAAIVGALWLGLLAVAAYLRIPDPPTPEIRSIPVPTALLIGGIALGLLVSLVAARVNRVGGRRRARTVRRRAERAVASAAQELVVEPMQAELDRRNELRQLLDQTSG